MQFALSSFRYTFSDTTINKCINKQVHKQQIYKIKMIFIFTNNIIRYEALNMTKCKGHTKTGKECNFKATYNRNGIIDKDNPEYCKHHWKQGSIDQEQPQEQLYYNETSVFTQEPVSNLTHPVIYEVSIENKDGVEEVEIKEDYLKLREWYNRREGQYKPFKCIHTQMILSPEQNTALYREFKRLETIYQLDEKVIKTYYDELYDLCFKLDSDSHIFLNIFRCLTPSMLKTYITELDIQINIHFPDYEFYSVSHYSKLQDKKYTKKEVINICEKGQVKRQNEYIDYNSLNEPDKGRVMRDIRDFTSKKYIAERILAFYLSNEVGDASSPIKLDMFTSPYVWNFVAQKYIPDTTEETCFDKLISNNNIWSYDTNRFCS